MLRENIFSLVDGCNAMLKENIIFSLVNAMLRENISFGLGAICIVCCATGCCLTFWNESSKGTIKAPPTLDTNY
jgi:hypothetical protein